MGADIPAGPLRSGWTTGACATAATRAAYQALLGGGFPDPVATPLPQGRRPEFPLARAESGEGWAQAGVVKDAGDDPDVTHGVTVIATVRPGEPGTGVTFVAGEGVGTVTLPGLPVAVGEPAINPAPRRMITEAVADVAARFGGSGDVVVEISIPGGADVAHRTWNPRLGIVGGLSVLGTTGVVVPYSCSAWIHSIHRGIDVARALGLEHVAGCTGSTSEAAVQGRFGLPDVAMLDMGDFAGGMLTYLKRHPVPRLTVGGGFAKLSKLAAGHLDLHSSRSQVDIGNLAGLLAAAGAPAETVSGAAEARTALHVLEIARAAGRDAELAARVGEAARAVAARALGDAPVTVGVVVVDRDGTILADVT
jgi:cobalt-precorrin-5B (C1)-methyltransferase